MEKPRKSMPMSTHDWSPFILADEGESLLAPRPINTLPGIGDRIRIAAFSEFMAIHAFLWAADHYEDASPELKDAWKALSKEEENHYGWLMKRMSELAIDPAERKVSDRLWDSFLACKTARDFSLYMATAEQRGMVAGETVAKKLKIDDPETSRIFGKIAFEEIKHVEHAMKFYPDLKSEFERKTK